MFFKKKEELDPNIIKKIYHNSRIQRYLIFVFGVILMSLAYNIFVLSSNIVYGAGGIGVILKKIYHIDPSITI